MNLNEFALSTNTRLKKKALKVVYLQNRTTTNERKRKASTGTTGSKSTDRWHSDTNSVTAVSNTTITTLDEFGIIVAITEGRGEASCEVGISAINIQHPELSLFQISDTSSYIRVLNKIHILNPFEILVPLTLANSRLVNSLKITFPAVKIIAIDRYAFRKDCGQQFVKDVCAKIYNPVLLILQHKYYTLAATGALRLYLETYKRQFYAKESMKVTYSESDYNTMIDVFVADKLELVSCALDNGRDSVHRKNSSLRGILNHCVTKLGSRLLRSTILQPPNHLNEITSRLNCVEELFKCPEKLLAIRDTLKKLSSFGQVLSLATILKANAQYCDERHLNYILLLNSFFDEIEAMKDLFLPCKAKFFQEVFKTLNRDEFKQLNEAFKRIIHEDARPSFGKQAQLSRVFAIRSGHSEILDFLRIKYSNRVEEMRAHVTEAAQAAGYDLKLDNNQKKGYHMVLQLGAKQRTKFNKSTLPLGFCQVDVMTTMVTMKTIKLITLSNLLDDTATEIINTSNIFLHELLLEVQKHISVFYDMCEQIAKLDLLQSLAQATASGVKYIRPEFDSFTRVIDGRHPLLDYILSTEPVPNNIVVTPENRLHLITGPNGSGKSIYIRQIVLLQIMAQIGCFVPATSATFRICDRILARIYFEDNMECGTSTFMLEMKDIKYFLNVITDKTLIIIDELCRSTAVREGTALAMSICEQLMRTPAFIYFTTHYTYITKLQEIYKHIRCWQMETKEIHCFGRKPRLQFTHKLIPGIVTLEAYGLALTRYVWPDHIIQDCEEILAKINDLSLETSVDKKLVLKINLENQLWELKRIRKCDKSTAYKMWLDYKESLEKLGVFINFNEYNDKQNAIAVINVDNNNQSITPKNITQTGDVDMNITLQECNAAIDKSQVNNTKEVLDASTCTTLTEASYLQRNQCNQSINLTTERCIEESISSKTQSLNDSSIKHLQNFTILQNLTIQPKKVHVSNKGNPVVPIQQRIQPKEISNTPNSGVELKDKQLLHDNDDHLFVQLSQTSNHNQQIETTAFAKFSQQIKEIQEKSQDSKINETVDTQSKFSKFSFNTNKDNLIESSTEKAPSQCWWSKSKPDGNTSEFKFEVPTVKTCDVNLDFSFGNEDENSQTNFNNALFMNVNDQSDYNNEGGSNIFNFDNNDERDQNIFGGIKSQNLQHDSKNCSFMKDTIKNDNEKGEKTVFNFGTQNQNDNILEDDVIFSCDRDSVGYENDEDVDVDEEIQKLESAVSDNPIFENKDGATNNTTSSITSTKFLNNLRMENTSTPNPQPEPLPSVSFDNIESRLKFAQDNFNLNNKNTTLTNDQLPTNLINNVLSPATSTTGTKPKTKTTDTTNMSNLRTKKRKLLNSAELNMDYEDNETVFDTEHRDRPSTSQGIAGFTSQDSCKSPEIENIFSPDVVDLCSPADFAINRESKNHASYLNTLNRRELESFYNTRRINAIQSTNREEIEAYYNELMNRPSMRQMQASEVVVAARRTTDGQCVFDTVKKRKRFEPPFKKERSFGKNVKFDTTMFSDANARVFDEFIEYKKSSTDKDAMDFKAFKRRSESSSNWE